MTPEELQADRDRWKARAEEAIRQNEKLTEQANARIAANTVLRAKAEGAVELGAQLAQATEQLWDLRTELFAAKEQAERAKMALEKAGITLPPLPSAEERLQKNAEETHWQNVEWTR